ncbi:hypothetical protein [Paraburkholderia tropica]|uniref:hypothetical protein n=1 Tax=Paraburkholderia TaxID=1822464 RepID=UPI002AB63C85|nr:hypothetical protein [Paraburkholderia tropica]
MAPTIAGTVRQSAPIMPGPNCSAKLQDSFVGKVTASQQNSGDMDRRRSERAPFRKEQAGKRQPE